VDDQGRPVRGSGVQRFAQSFRTLPTSIGQETKYMDEVERAARLAAFQATEKEIDSTRAANIKLLESQRKAFSDIIKQDGGGAFGKSLTGRIANMFSSDLVTKFAKGETSPEQDRQFVTAVTQYTQPTETKDPETGLTKLFQPRLPDHVQLAIQTRNLNPRDLVSGESQVPVISKPKVGEIPTTADMASRSIATGANINELPKEVKTVVENAPAATFLDLAETGTGLVPVLVGGVMKRVPLDIAGSIAPQFQQSTALLSGLNNRLVTALQENPRLSEGERKSIKSELDTLPTLLTNTIAFQNKAIAIDAMLESIENRENSIINNEKTGVENRKNAQAKLETMKQMRDIIGIKDRKVNSAEEWASLPPGNYVAFDPDRKIYVPRPKKR
jgi:hypothetical protein